MYEVLRTFKGSGGEQIAAGTRVDGSEFGNLLSLRRQGYLAQVVALDLSGLDLSEDAVNAILVQLDAMESDNGTVDLSGGTNAVPTGAGVTAAANLAARGWSVTVNEE